MEATLHIIASLLLSIAIKYNPKKVVIKPKNIREVVVKLFVEVSENTIPAVYVRKRAIENAILTILAINFQLCLNGRSLIIYLL